MKVSHSADTVVTCECSLFTRAHKPDGKHGEKHTASGMKHGCHVRLVQMLFGFFKGSVLGVESNKDLMTDNVHHAKVTHDKERCNRKEQRVSLR